MKYVVQTAVFFMSFCMLSVNNFAADECIHYFSSQTDARETHSAIYKPLKHSTLQNGAGLDPYRGTIVLRLTVNEPFGGHPSYVEIYPGPPRLNVHLSADWPKDKSGKILNKDGLIVKSRINLEHKYDSNPLETIQTTSNLIQPGSELHFAWTWSGVVHRMYVNGRLVQKTIAKSPFPRTIESPVRFQNPYQDKAPAHEVAVYNFAMNPEQVQRDYSEKNNTPLQVKTQQKAHMVAQWAPGEQKVYVSLDVGNVLKDKAKKIRFSAFQNGTEIASEEIKPVTGGYCETILNLPAVPAGSYIAKASVLDEHNSVITQAASKQWNLPKTDWLRNNLGISNKVQSPWTPIERQNDTLKVWGRDLELAGGFGLPQQITSQNKPQLRNPVILEIVRDGKTLPITNNQLQITQVEEHQAQWQGQAIAGDVKIKVEGKLEYDGMVLLNLTLEPKDKNKPARIDSLDLSTVMPNERALFLNTSTDQGYWWYPYKGWIPKTPGVAHTNLKQRPQSTNFLFYVLFSDHETGLEWFADNLSGWQLDRKKMTQKPIQKIIRQENGDVQLLCHLSNQPFTLDKPITITFGYDATPVKPLPKDWRSTYVHHHKIKGLNSTMGLWWIWGGGEQEKHRGGIFNLRPNNLEGFAKDVKRSDIDYIAPFTNQHVILPAYPENQQEDKGWKWFGNILGAESDNDGWVAMPTRGVRDYWVWNIDRWIKSGGMDAIYIDEANSQTVSHSILSGSGYVRSDGTHAPGHNTLGMRQQLKRTRQLFIDNGKRPIVWLPVYAKIIPHAHAFIDVVSEGEAFMFDAPKDNWDWMDAWGKGLLDETGVAKNEAGDWMLSLGPAQKFGFTPVFLNYLKYYDKPEYHQAVRTQYALLALLDIIPIESRQAWFFKAKEDFGMSYPETLFHPYHSQKEIVASREDVKISYYRRDNKILAIVTNLGKDDFSGTVHFKLSEFGLKDPVQVTHLDEMSQKEYSTEVKCQPLDIDKGVIQIEIPSHDFRMIELK